MRQALPGAEKLLHSDAQTIQWLPDSPFTLDVAEFEKAVEHPDSMEALQYAANLYQGELLADSQKVLVTVADIAGNCQPAQATEWELDVNSGDFVEGTKMFFPTQTP